MPILNEGKVVVAKTPPGVFWRTTSPDGRGVWQRWVCGACDKEAKHLLETCLRHVERQCDFCLATNTMEFE